MPQSILQHVLHHFFIFTGRQPLWNIDFLLPNLEQNTETVPQYTAAVVDRLNKVNEIVRENLQSAADSASKWYNVKVHRKHFDEGTPVRIFYPRHFVGRSPKWRSFYKTTGEIVKKIMMQPTLSKAMRGNSQK